MAARAQEDRVGCLEARCRIAADLVGAVEPAATVEVRSAARSHRRDTAAEVCQRCAREESGRKGDSRIRIQGTAASCMSSGVRLADRMAACRVAVVPSSLGVGDRVHSVVA